jgi:hypothetical protein
MLKPSADFFAEGLDLFVQLVHYRKDENQLKT